jgi:hypothetical protein
MNTLIKLVALIGLFAGLTADTGEVYGTLTHGGRSVGAGIVIDALCAGRVRSRAITDGYGSYRLHVGRQSHCTLTVRYEGHSPALDIAMQRDRGTCNLLLQREGREYTLRRR